MFQLYQYIVSSSIFYHVNLNKYQTSYYLQSKPAITYKFKQKSFLNFLKVGEHIEFVKYYSIHEGILWMFLQILNSTGPNGPKGAE